MCKILGEPSHTYPTEMVSKESMSRDLSKSQQSLTDNYYTEWWINPKISAKNINKGNGNKIKKQKLPKRSSRSLFTVGNKEAAKVGHWDFQTISNGTKSEE